MTKTNKFNEFNDWDFQQVRNDIGTSVWKFYKKTMRINQLYRNLHRDGTTFGITNKDLHCQDK